jgi:hypothetical protein
VTQLTEFLSGNDFLHKTSEEGLVAAKKLLIKMDSDCILLGVVDLTGQKELYDIAALAALGAEDISAAMTEARSGIADRIKGYADVLENVRMKKWELAVTTRNLVLLNEALIQTGESGIALMTYLVGKKNSTYVCAKRASAT